MKTVQMTIQYYGHSRKYGGRKTYKVCPFVARLLTQAGWQLIHVGHSYVYLAPKDAAFRGDPTVTLEIPEDQEIEQLAQSLHSKGTAVEGIVSQWSYAYTPAHRTQSSFLQMSGTDVLMGLEQKRNQSVQSQIRKNLLSGSIPFTVHQTESENQADFRIGELTVWYVSLRWPNGKNTEPVWYRNTKGIRD